MSKSNLIRMGRYFVCLFRSSTQSSLLPHHIRTRFFPWEQQISIWSVKWLTKDLLQNTEQYKEHKGRFSASSTTSVLLTMTDAPMLTDNLPPWFIPWSWCPCQPYPTCITVCLDSLLKETDYFCPRKSQGTALWMDCPEDVTTRMGLDQ